MEQKKILIITHGFFPEQSPRSFRATELVKEFRRQGHNVTVMAPFRLATEFLANEYGFNYISLGNLKWSILNFNNRYLVGQLYNKVVNRLLPLFFEYPNLELCFKINKTLKKHLCRYDLLISVAVPYTVHWGVASNWKKNGLNVANRWIADCGDPYCLQENDTFRPPFYFRMIEKWFMQKVDYVTVPTKKSIFGYFSEFHGKIRVIPQGFRFEDIETRRTMEDGVIRFGYGGIFIPGKRDPKEFIIFLNSLSDNIKYEFHIFTSTPQFVLPYLGRNNRILVHQPINRKEFLETLSTYQFVVNFANQGNAQTPSKLIDYAIIGKPILNIETGRLDKQEVLAFLECDFSKALYIDDLENYRIEKVADAFLDLI